MIAFRIVDCCLEGHYGLVVVAEEPQIFAMFGEIGYLVGIEVLTFIDEEIFIVLL